MHFPFPHPHDDLDHFNLWAKTYDKSFLQGLFFGPIQSRMLDIVVKSSVRPRCILDVGCGTGRLLRAAALRWPNVKLIGVDPAEQMIAEAGRLTPNAVFKISPAEAIPLPYGTVDLVFSSLSFHHWSDQPKGLREISRVLCPGGRFCLADHTTVLAGLFHEKAKTRAELRALFNDAGFKVLKQKRMWSRFVLITLAEK
jgi:ubiquinone/menaquinone biosynthesis C-methylase UbiE